MECIPCPATGFCPSQYVLLPKKGHWQAQRCSNSPINGTITSDACQLIDKCDSDGACQGRLQLLAKPESALSNETKLSDMVFNISTTEMLSLAVLNKPEELRQEAFLQAQCSNGCEGWVYTAAVAT
jgi:hypothetical protein